jgi:uncharacterized protein (UPF0218 family)
VLDNGEKAFEFAYGSTNSVIITLAEQVLTTVGAVSLLVSFVLDDEILSTFNIVLDVSENPGIDVAESEDYFSLSAAIDAAEKVVGEMLDPNAFASKEYVDGVIGDLREDLDEIADDAKVFYVTISKSDDGSFVADKSVDVIRSAYDNGRTVKAVVDDDGEQVTIPLIAIIEGDTVMYVGYGANSNRIVVSQTDILVSVHNDALPNVKTVNGVSPDENGNVELDIQSGGGGGSSEGGAFYFTVILEEDVRLVNLQMPVDWGRIIQFNIHGDTMGNSLTAEIPLQTEVGGSYNNQSTLSTNLKGVDFYGIRYMWYDTTTRFTVGVSIADNSSDMAFPAMGTTYRPNPDNNKNNFALISRDAGALFPKGMRFDVWGVYGP